MNKEVRAGSEEGETGTSNGERNEYVRTRIDVARVSKAINGQRTSRETGRAILAFIATVAVAWLMRWEAGDLMWGAWASSLSFGYVYALVLILARPEEVDAPAGLAQPGRILAMIAFFTFTFGLFHLWQGVVLNLVFPISEREGLGILLSPASAFPSYWHVIAATFFSRLHEIKDATQPSEDTQRLLWPYVNVVRMQVLVFVFLFMEAAGLIRFAVYPVLVFYFFPFPIVVEKLKYWFGKLDDRMNTP